MSSFLNQSKFQLAAIVLFASIGFQPLYAIELEIWTDNKQYVKLIPWDQTRTSKSAHPFPADPNHLEILLNALNVDGVDNGQKLFMPLQAKLLASNIAIGLDRANSKLDISFLVRNELVDDQTIAGRVFYIDGRLNLIMGNRNGKQASRRKKLVDYIKVTTSAMGISLVPGRPDWLQINLEVAALNLQKNDIELIVPSNEGLQSKNNQAIIEFLRQENLSLKKKILELEESLHRLGSQSAN